MCHEVGPAIGVLPHVVQKPGHDLGDCGNQVVPGDLLGRMLRPVSPPGPVRWRREGEANRDHRQQQRPRDPRPPGTQPVHNREAERPRRGGVRGPQAEHIGEAPRGPGSIPGVRLRVDLGQPSEHHRSPADLVLGPAQHHERPEKVDVGRGDPREGGRLAIHEESGHGGIVTSQPTLDRAEESLGRCLGQERQNVDQGVPPPPRVIGVDPVHDLTHHAIGVLLPGVTIAQTAVPDVARDEGRASRRAPRAAGASTCGARRRPPP